MANPQNDPLVAGIKSGILAADQEETMEKIQDEHTPKEESNS